MQLRPDLKTGYELSIRWFLSNHSPVLVSAGLGNGRGRPDIREFLLGPDALVIHTVTITNALVVCRNTPLQIITFLGLLADFITLPELKVLIVTATTCRLSHEILPRLVESVGHLATHGRDGLAVGIDPRRVHRLGVHAPLFILCDTHLA